MSFKIRYDDGQYAVKTVKVDATKQKPDSVTVFDGEPGDGSRVTARCTMDRDVFFDVYTNKLSPRNAVLSGKVKVDGWRFKELYNFGSSFSLTTKAWTDFYEWCH